MDTLPVLLLRTFCLIVVSTSLIQANVAPTQDERIGNRELWDEVWKNIKDNNEKVGDDNPTHKNVQKLQNWEENLQNQLDKVASPPRSMPTKPNKEGASLDTSNKKIDFKEVMDVLQGSGVKFSNEQWMQFLQFVLSSTNNAILTIPKPSTTTMPRTQADRFPLGDKNGQGDVPKGLPSRFKPNSGAGRGKALPHTETINPPHSTDSASPKPNEVGDNEIISDEQFYQLLEKMNSNDDVISTDEELKSTSLPPPSPSFSFVRGSGIIPDEEWERRLKVMNNGKDNPGHDSGIIKPTSTGAPSTVTGSSTAQLIHDLQKAFIDANHGQEKINGFIPSTTTAMPTTSEKSTTTNINVKDDVGNRQWIRLLQQAMDIKARDDPSDVDGNRLWMQLLQLAMNNELTSDASNVAKEQAKRKIPEIQPKQASTSTPSVQEEVTDNDHEENMKISDQEWERRLMGAMDKVGQEEIKSPLKSVLEPHSTTQRYSDEDTTNDQEWEHLLSAAMDQAGQGHFDSPSMSQPQPTGKFFSDDDSAADEQWEKFINLETSVNNLDTVTTTRKPVTSTSGKPREDPTTHSSTTSEEVENLPNPQHHKGFSKEKMESTDNTNYLLLLGFGIGCGTVILCVSVFMVIVVCRRKGLMCWSVKDKHTTVLNTDGNRWDPQILRPSKENMNAFLYGIPTPMEEIRY